jgi:hypothetical protein
MNKKVKIYCYAKCKIDEKQCEECAGLEQQFFRFKFQVRKNSSRSQTIVDENTLLQTFANHLSDRKIIGKVLVYE